VTSRVEEDVPDPSAFLHADDVAADSLEAERVLVEISGLVEVVGREPDVREALVGHDVPSFSGLDATRSGAPSGAGCQRFSAGVDVAGPIPQTWMIVSSFFAPS